MGLAERVTQISDGDRAEGSIAFRARARRWDRMLETFPDLDRMRVLDLGGRVHFWMHAPIRPLAVTTVNLESADGDLDGVTHVQADACVLDVNRLGTFDLVVSNSLIEHVGGHVQRERLADVVSRAAGAHWIQTPYRYFPVEPHWLFPLLQFMPFEMRIRVSQLWPFGHMKASSRSHAYTYVAGTELLSISQMRFLFPESGIWIERWHGLPKSMVAVRS